MTADCLETVYTTSPQAAIQKVGLFKANSLALFTAYYKLEVGANLAQVQYQRRGAMAICTEIQSSSTKWQCN